MIRVVFYIYREPSRYQTPILVKTSELHPNDKDKVSWLVYGEIHLEIFAYFL